MQAARESSFSLRSCVAKGDVTFSGPQATPDSAETAQQSECYANICPPSSICRPCVMQAAREIFSPFTSRVAKGDMTSTGALHSADCSFANYQNWPTCSSEFCPSSQVATALAMSALRSHLFATQGHMYLPPASVNVSAEQTRQYVALGRMLVKCLLEGIHVPLNLSAAMHCMLVHRETLSSHADTCVAMLAN